MTVSDNFAVVAGKLSAGAIRVFGAGLGSNLPGRVARRLSGKVLAQLGEQRRRGILAVSGTNGKSTTTGFLYSILRRAGLKTVHNRQGANLITGITATLLDAASWDGKVDADYCLFEIDEASLPVVAAEVNIEAVLVTNLFRDQLDRFGELDTTAKLINKGIALKGSRAILNADDPNVAQLAPQSQRLYYGIESVSESSTAASGNMELSYCAGCGKEYAYSLVFYGQLGHYKCPACDAGRPVPEVSAHNVVAGQRGSHFQLKVGNETLEVAITLPGLFNVYNALAAAALAYSIGIPAITIKDGLINYVTLFGRSERLIVDGKTVLIQLIKNPAGASQVVNTVAQDPHARLLIAINDNLADGRDISWLWDAEFEKLSDHRHSITISGQRAEDMAVRMKYAGIPASALCVTPQLEQALRDALDSTAVSQTLWILPTYTCLLDLQKIFKTMGHSLSGT